jgi:ribosomal protein L29
MIDSREQTIEQLTKENDGMREELVELKRSIDYQQAQIQTDKK